MQQLLQADVVVTAYSMVRARRYEDVVDSNGKRMSWTKFIFFTGGVDGPLFKIFWSRVVLDESHAIKGNGNEHIYALQCKYKWCVSGTPAQTSPTDLVNQLKWLGIDSGICDSLMSTGVNTATSLLKQVGIRHTKDMEWVQRDLAAFGMHAEQDQMVVNVQLGDDERAAYDKVAQAVRDKYVYMKEQVPTGNWRFQATALMMPLRQLCTGAVPDDKVPESMYTVHMMMIM